MNKKVTRRGIAALLVTASPLLAQSQEPLKTQPVDDLHRAIGEVRANSRKLSSIAVPMSTEPAMQFKV
jgi:hypothetical protein